MHLALHSIIRKRPSCSTTITIRTNKNDHFFGFPKDEENKSPADGNGTGSGNLDKSGKFSKCDFSSFLTEVTFSSFVSYSCMKKKNNALKYCNCTQETTIIYKQLLL